MSSTSKSAALRGAILVLTMTSMAAAQAGGHHHGAAPSSKSTKGSANSDAADPASAVHEAMGHDMSAMGSGHDMSNMSGHDMSKMGAGGMMSVHSRAERVDIDGGAKLVFTSGAADVAKLQGELRMHAEHMSTGTCAYSVAIVKLTATWQFVTLPALPVYCR